MLRTIAAALLVTVASAPALAQDNHQGGQPQQGPHDQGGRHDGGRPGGQGFRPEGQRGGRGAAMVPAGRPMAQPGAQRGPDRGFDHGRPGGGFDRGRRDGGDVRGGDGGFVGGHPGGDDHRGAPPQADRRGPEGHGFDHRSEGGVAVWRGNESHGGYGRPGYRGNDRGGAWNRGWRDNSRYDWRGWRSSHRDVYRVGRYRAPHGYGGGYRRFSVGVRIAPGFFARDYWIDNPGYYRLPLADGPYRWVRYYNDALLVDIYSGQVVDEIPDFFFY